MHAHRPRVLFLLNTLLSLFLVACFGGHGGGGGGGNGGNGGGGGGGGNGGGGGGTPGTVAIVQPTIEFPQVVAGSTLTFEAKVSGGGNGTGVAWGVQSGDSCSGNNFMSTLGVAGGAGNVGTIPASTPNKALATYTAPSAAALNGSPFIKVTVTALQSPETTGPCIVLFVVPTNNSLFSFNYVFRLKGFSNSSGLPFGIIGRFFADGKGNITSGFEDVNIAQGDGSSVAFPKAAFTGTYSMDTSNHGTMTLTVTSPTPWSASPPSNPPPTTMTFSFTLSIDGTFGGLIETDGAASPASVGSGEFQFQGNSVNFTTNNIVGSYAISLAGTAGVRASAVQEGVVGRLDLTASTSSTGLIAATSSSDDQSGGPTGLSGTYAIDDQQNGHGTFAIAGVPGTTDVSFYIGGPKRFYALRMDPNPAGNGAILLGAAHFMSGGAQFNNTSLGSAVFQLLGITDSHSLSGPGRATAAVGVAVGGAQVQPPSTTNGFLQGIIDLNDGGSVPNSLPIAFNPNTPATFTIAPNGRGTISITLPGPGGPVQYKFVFYLRGQSVGYVLEQPASDGSNRGRSGVFFPQTITHGPDGTFVGLTQVATSASVNGLAVLPLSVSGSSGDFQNGTGYASVLGLAATSGVANGTFTITDTTNNRGTVNVTSNGGIAGSATAAFYVLSDNEVILVGTDSTNVQPQIILLTNSLPDT